MNLDHLPDCGAKRLLDLAVLERLQRDPALDTFRLDDFVDRIELVLVVGQHHQFLFLLPQCELGFRVLKIKPLLDLLRCLIDDVFHFLHIHFRHYIKG